MEWLRLALRLLWRGVPRGHGDGNACAVQLQLQRLCVDWLTGGRRRVGECKLDDRRGRSARRREDDACRIRPMSRRYAGRSALVGYDGESWWFFIPDRDPLHGPSRQGQTVSRPRRAPFTVEGWTNVLPGRASHRVGFRGSSVCSSASGGSHEDRSVKFIQIDLPRSVKNESAPCPGKGCLPRSLIAATAGSGRSAEA